MSIYVMYDIEWIGDTQLFSFIIEQEDCSRILAAFFVLLLRITLT